MPAGATRIAASLSGASDPGADLDLYLFDCTSGQCVLKARSTSASSTESVSATNPAPGTWATLVNAFAVPAGSTTYQYRDSYNAPGLGAVTITDAAADRPAGSSWERTASATATASPGDDRFWLGSVTVREGATETGTALGQAEVRLIP